MTESPNDDLIGANVGARTGEDYRAGVTLELHAEEMTAAVREVERGRVRVRVETITHERPVDETLRHERVEIERVAIGRLVDAVPPVREEGDVTIVPVVEEIVVVERRLVLKEEIHLRRIRTTSRHQESVPVREQIAIIERTGADKAGGPNLPATVETDIPSNRQGAHQ